MWGQRESLVWVTLGLRYHEHTGRGQEPVDSGSQAQKEPGLEQIRNVGTQRVTEASGVDCMTQGSCERRMGKGIWDRALEGSLVSKGRSRVQEGAR